MRVLLLILILSLFFMAPMAAQAGQIATIDGKGRWVSTECKVPVEPGSMGKNAEVPANDLNAKVTAHNKYAEEARVYMECLSKEAERDVKAIGKMIIDEASRSMDEISNKVKNAADALRNK